MTTLEEQQEEILRDPNYVNWVKGSLSLKVTKKGLEHFITTNTDKFHADTLKPLATSAYCSKCSNEDIVRKNWKCPNSVCDQIKNTIVNAHRFKGPTWKNTDVQGWFKDPWELAKCFMPKGYESKTSASETDLAGLLAVIINHRMFASQVTASLATKSNIFCEARDVRNKILHQAEEKLTNQELKDCITKLDLILSDPACLASHQDAIDAKLMLDQILTGSLSITNEDIQEAQELRSLAKKQKEALEKIKDDAVKVIQAKTEANLLALDKKENTSEKVIHAKTDDGLTALDKKAKKSETVLQAKTDDGLTALDKKEKNSEKVIQAKTDDSLTALDKKEKNYEKVIQAKTDVGLTALDKKEKNSEKVIQAKTDDSLTALDKKEKNSEKVIQANTDDGLTALDSKEKNSEKVIQAKTDDCLTALDKKEKNSEKVIQAKTDDGLTALDTKGKNSEKIIQEKTEDGLSALEIKAKETEMFLQIKKEEAVAAVQTASKDSYEQLNKDEICRKVLRNCYTKLVDDMDPTLVIDQFHEIEFLPSTTLRDIREKPSTSDMNRAIIDKVLSKGDQGYTSFKECLQKTEQGLLVDHLLKIEKQLSQEVQPSAKPRQPNKQHQMQEEQPTQSHKYEEMIQELISAYEYDDDQLTSAPLFPLAHTERRNIDEMYVKPNMKIGDENINSYRDIFKDGRKKIYLVGDAGLGKSSLCQQMVSTWCKVHSAVNIGTMPDDQQTSVHSETNASDWLSEHNRLADKDNLLANQQAMAQFDFLFYVSLRDANNQNDVEDMIKDQLIDDKFHKDLPEVLKKEKCLVILDGLDEWMRDNTKARKQNKGLPALQAIRNCTILTTTRPWKLEVIKLTTTQIDAKIELLGIGKVSSGMLIEIMLHHLNKKNNKHMQKKDCISEIRRNKLDLFMTIPVILKQLICLWHSGKPLGQTKSAIYSQMMDLLLELGQSRLNENPKYQEKKNEWINSTIQLPSCFNEKGKCQKFKPLLVGLGRLSFHTLLNNNQESSLVFEHSEAEIHGMTAEDITISLNIGILSQSGIIKDCKSQKKLSFLHKSYQEYFAALFVSIKQTEYNQCVQTIQQICNSERKCLEMKNMITFISGMCSSETTCTLMGHIRSHVDSVRTWQHYLTDCLSEGWCCSHGNTHLLCNDVYIQDVYKPEHLELLCQANIHNMKLLVLFKPPTASCLEYILHVDTLEKLTIYSTYSTTPNISEDNLYSLIHNNSSTLTHLTIGGITLRSRTKLSTLLQQIPHLSWLGMSRTPMSQQLSDSLRDLEAKRPDIDVDIDDPEILQDTECTD